MEEGHRESYVYPFMKLTTAARVAASCNSRYSTSCAMSPEYAYWGLEPAPTRKAKLPSTAGWAVVAKSAAAPESLYATVRPRVKLDAVASGQSKPGRDG
jgi:hypothetical protein